MVYTEREPGSRKTVFLSSLYFLDIKLKRMKRKPNFVPDSRVFYWTLPWHLLRTPNSIILRQIIFICNDPIIKWLLTKNCFNDFFWQLVFNSRECLHPRQWHTIHSFLCSRNSMSFCFLSSSCYCGATQKNSQCYRSSSLPVLWSESRPNTYYHLEKGTP